jgi:hypothetical protein
MRDFIPIENVQISHITGRFRRSAATHPAYAFALYAKPVNLLREPCTCFALGSCDVCQAWAATMALNAARRTSQC